MARKARSVEPGLLHHVTQRGNNREPVFQTDQDRLDYLSLLRLLSEPTGVEIFGFCLMSNHVHLVLRPRGEDSMAVFMRQTQCGYATSFNRQWGRCGHLWQSRYFSCALEGKHGLNALRYVDRNPVQAQLAERPSQYRWSSAAAHCLKEQDEFGLLSMEWTTWWDWPEWTNFIAGDDPESEEMIRLHTRLGRRLGQPRIKTASIPS